MPLGNDVKLSLGLPHFPRAQSFPTAKRTKACLAIPMDITTSTTVAMLTGGQAPSDAPFPSQQPGQDTRATVLSLALSPTLSRSSSPVNETNASLPPVPRDSTDMENIATPMSGTTAAGSCHPLPENPTTVSADCLSLKSGPSTSSGHHRSVSSSSASPFHESSTHPEPLSTSLSILLLVALKPSGSSGLRSSSFVTSIPRAVPEGRSSIPGKPPQPPVVSTESVISGRSTLRCPAVPTQADTTTQPPNPNSHVPASAGSSPIGHSLPSEVACVPTSLSPSTTTPFTQGAATSRGLGTSGAFQSPNTMSTPPSITSTGLTTLADGTVVPLTQAMANSAQGTSSSSPSHTFFGNHPVVISVFLVSGMIVALIIVLALRCCRRRQREGQHPEEKLQDISAPLPQNPFSMREHVGPHGRWDGFVRSGNQPTPMRSTSSIPLNRGEESVTATQAIVQNAPPSPPPPSQQPQQRLKNRLSYRVPVPYAGLAVHGSNSQNADQQYIVPFNDYHPVPVVQKHPTQSVPPPPPKRSPLRLLTTKNDVKTPQEISQRLSGTSSLSQYSASLSPSDADVDSLYQKEVGIFQSRDTSDSSTKGRSSGNNSGLERRREKSSKNNKSTALSGVNSDAASSPWKRTLQR